MKAKKINSYVKPFVNKGTSGVLIESGPNKGQYLRKINVYEIIGDAGVQESYKKACGDRYVPNENGNGLFFTDKVLGDIIELGVAKNSGRVFLNDGTNTDLITLANQYSGKVGEHLARLAAEKIMSSIGNNSSVASVVAAEPVETEESKAALDA